jgi:hypothetical protein
MKSSLATGLPPASFQMATITGKSPSALFGRPRTPELRQGAGTAHHPRATRIVRRIAQRQQLLMGHGSQVTDLRSDPLVRYGFMLLPASRGPRVGPVANLHT